MFNEYRKKLNKNAIHKHVILVYASCNQSVIHIC